MLHIALSTTPTTFHLSPVLDALGACYSTSCSAIREDRLARRTWQRKGTCAAKRCLFVVLMRGPSCKAVCGNCEASRRVTNAEMYTTALRRQLAKPTVPKIASREGAERRTENQSTCMQSSHNNNLESSRFCHFFDTMNTMRDASQWKQQTEVNDMKPWSHIAILIAVCVLQYGQHLVVSGFIFNGGIN